MACQRDRTSPDELAMLLQLLFDDRASAPRSSMFFFSRRTPHSKNVSRATWMYVETQDQIGRRGLEVRCAHTRRKWDGHKMSNVFISVPSLHHQARLCSQVMRGAGNTSLVATNMTGSLSSDPQLKYLIRAICTWRDVGATRKHRGQDSMSLTPQPTVSVLRYGSTSSVHGYAPPNRAALRTRRT